VSSKYSHQYQSDVKNVAIFGPIGIGIGPPLGLASLWIKFQIETYRPSVLVPVLLVVRTGIVRKVAVSSHFQISNQAWGGLPVRYTSLLLFSIILHHTSQTTILTCYILALLMSSYTMAQSLQLVNNKSLIDEGGAEQANDVLKRGQQLAFKLEAVPHMSWGQLLGASGLCAELEVKQEEAMSERGSLGLLIIVQKVRPCLLS
jgi:hypothetical protein